MQRAGTLFFATVSWVLCSLAPASAQSVQEGDLYDCEDFIYQEQAQRIYDRDPSDPYGLDGPIGEASEGIKGVPCEDLPHRPTSGGGPAGEQYGKPGPVDNPKGVRPGTTVKKMPKTDGPPYLAYGAVALLAGALVVGRGALRR